MDLLRGRRLRRLTQAVYDGAAAERGDDVERRESRWLPGPMTLLALVIVLLLDSGGSLWRVVRATPGPAVAVRTGQSEDRSWDLQSGAADGGGAGGSSTGDATGSAPDPSALPHPSAGSTGATVTVYVTGRVATPGVVELAEGSRVVDALDRAGGTTEGADLEALNLARILTDGEHIIVWARGEAPAGGEGSGGGSGSSGTGAGGGSACVDLASADAAALQTLDGVGPALAGRIIAYREQVGTISSVEQLDEVPGIGPTLVQRMSVGVCP